MSSEEGPLSRWARRKAETRKTRGGAAPVIEEAAKPAVPAAAPAAEGVEAAEPLPPPDLPDIDSLTAESDFTAFLKEGVPQQLRRLALRKLWTSDPVLANLDGLIDYGEDYTNAAMVVEGMKSAWEVGRGYAKDEPAAEGPAEGADAADGGMVDVEPGDDEPQIAAGKTAEESVEADSEAEEDDGSGTG